MHFVMTFNEKIIVCLLGLLPISLAFSPVSCPAGFEISSRSTCLKLVYRGSGFENVMDANDACKSLGTYMARMLTIDDNSLMRNMLENVKRNHGLDHAYAFLGGSDIAVEGDFVWTNAISIDQSFWFPGEPNDYQGIRIDGEDCIVLHYAGKLNDIPCCSRWWSVTSVICEYDPTTNGSFTNDDVFYEKCGMSSSTTHIQSSSEYTSSTDFSALDYSAITSKENNTATDGVPYLSVSPSQKSPFGEFKTTEHEGNTMLEMTDYPSSPLVLGSSIMEESLNPTPELDPSDTGFAPSDNGQNIRSTASTGSESFGSEHVVEPTSLLYLDTSIVFTSMTAGPQSSIEFISVTPTQLAKVTEINLYVSYTLSPVSVSHRVVRLIPRPRWRCSNKSHTQYQTDIKINMLKVRRNETQRFKRRFICAQDNRMSPLIIGVVSCILLLVSYLLIVVTDLLEIRSIKRALKINRKNDNTRNGR